jgi:hypothetical protein
MKHRRYSIRATDAIDNPWTVAGDCPRRGSHGCLSQAMGRQF